MDASPYARKLAKDLAPELRAEAALEMSYRDFDKTRDVLVAVAEGYDNKDASYLEALGLGAGHHTKKLWSAIKQSMKPGAAVKWSDTFARLTWRLMPEAAVDSLKARASEPLLTDHQRELALDSLAFSKSKESAHALMDVADDGSPVKKQALWWLINRGEGAWADLQLRPEMEKRGLVEKLAALVEVIVPAKPTDMKFTVEPVMALKGDGARGKLAAGRCIMCHQIDGAGAEHGPNLKGFGSRQAPEVLARSIIDPSFDISHGYEGTA